MSVQINEPKQMKTYIILSLLTALVISSTAQTPPQKTDTTRAQFLQKAAERFDKMDTNSDGTLDRSERQAQKDQRSQRAKASKPKRGPRDTNGDGVITEADFPEHKRKHFSKIDANQNGTLEPAELKAHKQKRKAKRQASMDQNGDGYITEADFTQRAQERFARLDKNNNGTLDPEEQNRPRRKR